MKRPTKRGALFIWLVISSLPHFSLAQSASPQIYQPHFNAKAPETAQLEQFSHVPVSPYTGVPNISVPIYNISSGGIEVPISLNYHASGIRVDERAGPYGLKWALNAGGRISRTVRGLRDEETGNKGWLTCPPIPNPVDMNNPTHFGYFDQVSKRQLDGEPDEFNVSLPGMSFSFVFDKNGTVHTNPYTPVKITGWPSSHWVITDSRGVEYHFGEDGNHESTLSESICNSSADGISQTIPDINAWMLTRIVSPYNNKTVRFEYFGTTIEETGMYDSETKYYQAGVIGAWSDDTFSSNPDAGQSCCAPPPTLKCSTNVTIKQRLLKRIIFDQGKFQINYGSGNAQIGYTGDYFVVEDNAGNTIKKYHLSYGVYSGDKRKRLDKVTEYGTDGSKKPPYLFSYDATPLPSRKSKSKDFYGYYNGAGNTTLLPSYFAGGRYYGGADRSPHPTKVKAGILTKVTYPTGGHTLFDYEINKVKRDQPIDVIQPMSKTFSIDNNQPIGTYNSTTFTIHPSAANQCGVLLKVNVNLNKGAVTSPHDPPSAFILQSNGTAIDVINDTCNRGKMQYTALGGAQVTSVSNGAIILKPGTYKLQIEKGHQIQKAFISLHWQQPTGQVIDWKYSGGLRVAKTQVFPAASSNPMVKKYEYNLFTSPGKTSGREGIFPFFKYYSTGSDKGCVCKWQTISTGPREAFETTKGSYVGYTNVKEIFGENGEKGYIEYDYTNFHNYPDVPPSYDWSVLGGTPKESLDHMRGLLTEKRTYKSGGQLQLQEIYDYLFSAPHFAQIAGVKAKRHNTVQIDLAHYKSRAQWVRSKSVITTSYDGSSNMSKKVENAGFNTFNGLPNVISTTNSDNKVSVQKILYPSDFSVAVTGHPKNLISGNNFFYSYPVGTFTYTDNKMTAASLNKYQISAQGKLMFKEAYKMEETGPLNASASTTLFNSVKNTGNTPSNFVLQSEMDYNSNGFVQNKKTLGVPTGVLWGHEHSKVIAALTNATSSDMAYAGMESDNMNSWTLHNGNSYYAVDPFTGKYARQVATGSNGPLKLLVAPDQNRRFKFSAWVKTPTGFGAGKGQLVAHTYQVGGNTSTYPANSGNINSHVAITFGTTANEWQYIEGFIDLKKIKAAAGIPGSTTLGLRFYIRNNDGAYALMVDDMRLHPVDAQMETYTFTPLKGVSSVLNSNNERHTYEYDVYNRLKLIRDHNGNILKRNQYNYK